MDATFEPVIEQIKTADRIVREAGWVEANSLKEMTSPDHRVWLSCTYTTGEYTMHASHRAKGFGVPRGNIRVRLTPALVEHYPDLGERLATELVEAAQVVEHDGFDAMVWPPPAWAEASVTGVVDLR